MGDHDNDIKTAGAIGALEAKIETVLDRQDQMEKKIDGIIAMTNRWKGATAILILLGGLVGWVSNLYLKMVGKL